MPAARHISRSPRMALAESACTCGSNCSAKKRDKDKKRHELVKVSLLGNILILNNQQITLCPQQGCGRHMVLNPDICEYNERGFACTFCSHKMQLKKKELIRNVKDVSIDMYQNTTCTRCNKKLTKQVPAFLYPHNIVLCQKHHSEQVVNAVSMMPESSTYDQILKEINRQIALRDEFNRLRYSKQQQAILNRSKRDFRRK